MLSLIYVSTAKPNLDDRQIDDLVSQAAEINKKNDVTGMLAFNGQNFIQLLEGAHADVEQTLERISLDSRHSDISIIRHEEINTRECPDWSMKRFMEPMRNAGDAMRVFYELPFSLRNDTKILFTSFASLLKDAC